MRVNRSVRADRDRDHLQERGNAAERSVEIEGEATRHQRVYTMRGIGRTEDCDHIAERKGQHDETKLPGLIKSTTKIVPDWALS